jgi:hypothetical protein
MWDRDVLIILLVLGLVVAIALMYQMNVHLDRLQRDVDTNIRPALRTDVQIGDIAQAIVNGPLTCVAMKTCMGDALTDPSGTSSMQVAVRGVIHAALIIPGTQLAADVLTTIQATVAGDSTTTGSILFQIQNAVDRDPTTTTTILTQIQGAIDADLTTQSNVRGVVEDALATAASTIYGQVVGIVRTTVDNDTTTMESIIAQIEDALVSDENSRETVRNIIEQALLGTPFTSMIKTNVLTVVHNALSTPSPDATILADLINIIKNALFNETEVAENVRILIRAALDIDPVTKENVRIILRGALDSDIVTKDNVRAILSDALATLAFITQIRGMIDSALRTDPIVIADIDSLITTFVENNVTPQIDCMKTDTSFLDTSIETLKTSINTDVLAKLVALNTYVDLHTVRNPSGFAAPAAITPNTITLIPFNTACN